MIEAPERTEPSPPIVKLQQAIALYRQGEMPRAEALLCEVLVCDPGEPNALMLLGLICEKRHDLEMAEQLLWRATEIKPHSRAYLNLGVVQQRRGDLNAAIVAYRRAIELEPDYAEAWTNLLFALDMHPEGTPELLRETRDSFDRTVCHPLTAQAPEHTNDRDPDRRLRVGYVGGDFRARHSASLSFGWLIDHDPEAVEVYLYSTAAGDDPTAEAFKARADVWSEVGDLSVAELVEVISSDQIDILVDLGGAAQGGRALAFACKPAPIQIGGWGYPHGLGMTALDYMVGDPIAVPPAHADRYRERILSLPCLMGYRYVGGLPDVGVAPEDRRGYRTYGYLGRAMKLTEPTLALWADLLRSQPTARLLLKSAQYADRPMRDRVVGTLVALGVEFSRIEVKGETTREQHLVAHREIDVALDPLVQGGGQTTLDACAMGVPTVTLPGESVSGRIGASILTAIGMPAWIVQDRREYVELARLGHVPNRLWTRERLLESVLVDGRAYARAVEVEYRAAWRRYVESTRHAPRSLGE